jgi:hypothetical protein
MFDEATKIPAWNALRVPLRTFPFYEIKEVVGLAGFDVVSLADVPAEQAGARGRLITAIDRGLNALDQESQKRFVSILAEEILKRRPEERQSLEDNLSRLGWSLSGNAVIPVDVFDVSNFKDLPSESHEDLTKAAQRLRDGDLSGSMAAACGALDATISAIYSSAGLGDPGKTSLQERWNRSLQEIGLVPKMERQLRELGWDDGNIKRLCKNFKGAMNQGASVMQTLRSKMGDVHGTKPVLKPLVFDCLKWAELMLRALMDD